VPDLDALRPTELMSPPVFINRLLWSRGYFETVAHVAVVTTDRLAQHCFHTARGIYADERGTELTKLATPCGDWALHSYRTVDDLIRDATGSARIHD
jgi:hypothetical protein